MSSTFNKAIVPYLKPAERIVYATGLGMLAIVLCFIYARGVPVDWPTYFQAFFFGILLIFSTGLVCRWRGIFLRTANGMIAVAGILFVGILGNAYNNLSTPLANEPIDAYIAKLDQALGFYWPDVMVWASNHPVIVSVLLTIYLATVPQQLIFIIMLSAFNKQRDLHRMMLVITISAVFVASFWAVFPTLGAKCFYNLPTEVWEKLTVPANQEYRETMLKMAKDGLSLVAPDEFRGLVAFPSYHMTLAMIAMMAAASFRLLFWPVVIFNLFVIPATWIHGGHHMLDFVGGAILFYISYLIAEWTLVRLEAKEGAPDNSIPSQPLAGLSLIPVFRK